MTIKAFESASNNSIHFYSEPSLATSANTATLSTLYSSELVRPDRKVFTSLFAPKTPVAKLNLRNRTAITFSTDLIKTSDTQTLFDYRGGSIDYEPTTVRKNLLTYTQEFNNTAWGVRWGGAGTLTNNNVIAPDGTLTGDSFVATLGGSGVGQAVSVTAGVTYTFSVWIRTAGGTTVAARTTADGSSGTDPRFVSATINANEWVRNVLTWTEIITGTRYVGVFANLSQPFDIWGAQLVVGSLAGAYQPVGASYIPLEHLITTADPGAHRRNLLSNTELFSAASWEGYFVKPTLTSGQLAPDGSLTAWSWSASATTGGPGSIYGGLLVRAPLSDAGKTVTVSIWLRASVPINIIFGVADTAQNAIGLTTTWQKFTLTGVIPVSNSRYIQLYDQDNTSTTIFLWHPQSEYGSVVTDYERVDASFFPTETAVTTVSVASVAPRVNLLTRTEDLTDSVWDKQNLGGTITSVAVSPHLSPAGTTAYQVLGLDTSGDRVDQATGIAAVLGQTYTYSVWLRGVGSINIAVNTTSGLGGGNEITIALTNNWVRYSVTGTYTSGVTGNVRIHSVITRTTGTAPEVHLWGPQLQVGSVATSYQRVDATLFLNENAVAGANTNPTITTQDPGAHRRNLLINTDVASGWNNSQFVTGVDQGQIRTFRGTSTYIKATAGGTADPFLGRNTTTGLIAGKTYTWSVVAWTDSGQPTAATLFMYGYPTTEQVKSASITLTTVPTLYTLTGTFTSGAVSTQMTCRLDLLDAGTNGAYLYATAPQLELGSIATDYERIDASFFPEELAVTTSNVTVVAPRKNILTQTESLNNIGTWFTNLTPAITANTILAPDGTLSAERFNTTTAGNGVFTIGAVTSLVPHTFSVYVKDLGSNCRLLVGSDNRPILAQITLNANTGQITSNGSNAVSWSSSPASNGWYRVSVTSTPTSLVTGPAYTIYSATSGAASFSIWGAQLETGNVATSYQRVDAALALADYVPDAANTGPTITTADPGAHRRNLLVNSQELNGSGWGIQNGAIVTGNTSIAPDGTLTADTVMSNPTNVFSAVNFPIALNLVPHTASIWVRGGNSTIGSFGVYNPVNLVFNNATNITISGPGSVTGSNLLYLTNLSNTEWSRVSFTFTPTVASNIFYFYPNDPAIQQAKTVLLWGAQLERGSVATDYERIDSSFYPTEYMTDTSNADIHYETGNVVGHLNSLTITPASTTSARAENKERILVQSSGNKLDMYIINQGQIVEYKTNTILITDSTSIVVGASNSGIRVFANGVQALSNTTSIAFFYNTIGNTSVKSQYLPSSTLDNLDRKISLSSGLNGAADTVTLYYTGD